MKWLLVLIVISTCACSIKPKYAFDTTDKALLTTAMVTQITDGYTTSRMLDNENNYEANPLYGSHPSDEKIIAIKLVGMVAIGYLAYELPPTPRKWVLTFFSILYGGATINNADKI